MSLKKFLCFILAFATVTIPVVSNASPSSISYYNFDDEGVSTIVDNGTNATDGKISQSLKWVSGVKNKALDLEGKDFVKISGLGEKLKDAPVINVFGSFKNHKMPSGEPKMYILSKLLIDKNLGGFLVYIENNNLILEARSSFDDKIQRITTPFNDVNNWHSFLATVDYTNSKMVLWLDGKNVVSANVKFLNKTYKSAKPDSPDFTIGGAGSNKFDGCVDEFYVFNQPIGEEEIFILFEENKVKDKIDNPYIVTMSDFQESITYKGEEFPISNLKNENGKFGSSLYFDSKNQYILGSEIEKAFNKKTMFNVAFWLKNENEAGGNLLSVYSASRKLIDISVSKNVLTAKIKSEISDKETVLSCEIDNINDWNHINLFVDFLNKVAVINLNGKETAKKENISFKNEKIKLPFSNIDMTIGEDFSGYIDEFVLLTKPLELKELKELQEKSVFEVDFSKKIKIKVNFDDISESKYAKSITEVCENGIMQGIGQNTFAPKNNFKREDLIMLIGDILEIREIKYQNSIKDIKSTDKFANEFQTLLNYGVIDVNMLKNQEFNPSKAITIEEISSILSRVYDKILVLPVSYEMKNLKIDSYAKKDIEKLYSLGILTDDMVNPDEYLTREQIANIISEFMKLFKKGV